MKMDHVATKEMIEAAGGDYETHPPMLEAPKDHPLWDKMVAEMREVYDPEIPVNIYELGLIYRVKIDEKNDVYVQMTLTSPGCPVAGEMPGMVQNAMARVEGLGTVEVELIWDPAWEPAFMAETAKLQLNMF